MANETETMMENKKARLAFSPWPLLPSVIIITTALLVHYDWKWKGVRALFATLHSALLPLGIFFTRGAKVILPYALGIVLSIGLGFLATRSLGVRSWRKYVAVAVAICAHLLLTFAINAVIVILTDVP